MIIAFANEALAEKSMTAALFDVVDMLDGARVHFTLERTRPDAIRVNAALVGERLEIDVFRDGHLEVARFSGSEAVEGGVEVLIERLRVSSIGVANAAA